MIDTKIQLNLGIDKDKLCWGQRAQANWLKVGDKNYSFFHNYASNRRRKNQIKSLKDEASRVMTDEWEMEVIVQSYFQNLFSLHGVGDLSHILSGTNGCIPNEVNQKLAMVYTKEKIMAALLEMGPMKASGEDGLPALFLQRCQSIMGNDVSKYYLQTLNYGLKIESLNTTNIVLIPKCAHLDSLVKFRPIKLM